MIKTFCENVSRKLFILVAGVLALLGSLCSLVSVRAADTGTAPGNFQVTIAEVPVLKIVLSSATASMTVTPSQGGPGFNTADLAVTVGTSSTAGYTLKMATSNNGALISGGNSMPTLDGTTDTSGNNYTCTIATATNCNFTTNSWGFRLSTDTANAFKGAPVESTEIVSYTDGATNGEVTNLQFGARVDADLPAGAYGTTVNFTAVANAELPDINDIATMQDFAALNSDELQAVVDSMATDTSYTLADSRDDNSYTIQKLADGNVWMLDNLQLDIAANKNNITSTNTNANDTTLNYLKNGGGASPYTTKAAANTSASNWTGNSPYNYYIQAMYNKDNANYDANYGNGTHKSGYYYNYCAASAGSYCYNSASGTGNASQDICPAGWQMPAGDTSAYSYQKLYEAYGSDYAVFKNALHAGLSGRFSGGIFNQGDYGYFWASTFVNTSNMRDLVVGASSVGPQGGSNRYYGFSVRCVLKASGLDTNITFSPNGADSGSATTLTLTSGSDSLPYDNFTKSGYRITSWNTAADGSGTSYAVNTPVTAGMNGLTLYAQWTTGTWMQRLADNSCTTTAKTVYDVRDGNSYTVQRLNDGLCWMLDNLALDPSAQELNSSNTNVTSTVTTTFENKTSGWNNTSPNDAWGKAYFNLASKDTQVTYGGGNTKVGGYYNYCATSAGTYCYANNASPDNTNATSDICPAGWKMPNGDTAKGSYYYLFNTGYSGNKSNFKNALHAGLSGYFWDSSALNQGSSGYGYFWSATRYDGTYMYDLAVGASSVYPQDNNDRYRGFSVRCVLNSN